ncbi:MAG TPA: sigma-54 dependent transcriptional regulator [Polyangiaceae bacterium]|nr:sigma-54 dependent transcriptional regulator [Polyangiaceae bacterium]
MTASEDTRPRVLLVDDDAGFRSVYAKLLGKDYAVDVADDRPSATALFERSPYAVVLLDLMLPPDGTVAAGNAQLKALIMRRPDAKIIVVSGAGDAPVLLAAIRDGAYDFITKPADPDVLLTVVERAARRHQLEHQLASLRESLSHALPSGSMLGASPKFTAALELAARVAPSALPVLILGENGTGKEMLARFVHEQSERSAKPFSSINCGAVPENLIESTLFGHRRGAFTGAVRDQPGLFTAADGGTLFLDEVADLTPAAQVKLLRALESGEILPVGAERPSRVDVRIISATNQDLSALRHSGQFREDLFWRIRGAEVTLPPLRERPGDIPLLAAHFLNQAAALTRLGQPPQLSPAALAALTQHPWPGNLRELRHEMQRASVLIGNRSQIDALDLSLAPPAAAPSRAHLSLQEQVEALERAAIERALTEHHGNRTHAADALGLSRQGLLKKMARYGFS